MSYVQNNQILGPQHHTLLYGIISKETTKYNYKYSTNINTLIGNIKNEIPRLLINDQEEINRTLKEIITIAKKKSSYTKIKAPTNEKRDKKKYCHKKCKSNMQESF